MIHANEFPGAAVAEPALGFFMAKYATPRTGVWV